VLFPELVAIKPRYILSDRANDTLRGTSPVRRGDEMAVKLGEKLSSLGDFQRPNPQPMLAEGMHEVFIGIGRHLNNATAALETIHGQLLAIQQQTKRRSPGGFARYLLAMCIGVAVLLAWQSYSEAARQLIAGWVPQLGWSKTPVVAENTAAKPFVPGTQQALKAPVAPSIDPEQVHQIASDVAAQRQTMVEIAAGQDQLAHVVDRLQGAVDRLQGAVSEILVKMPEPPPPPPVAAVIPAPKPIAPAILAPKPKPKPTAPPWSQRYGSPYGRPPYQ
jgi:hypothetical protein